MICPYCGYDNHPGSEYCSNCTNDLTQLDRPAPQDRVERSLLEDPVSALVPREAVTLPPAATVGRWAWFPCATCCGTSPACARTAAERGVRGQGSGVRGQKGPAGLFPDP